MKRIFCLLLLLLWSSCKQQTEESPEISKPITNINNDTQNRAKEDTIKQKTYSNERFREVTVARTDTNQFRISGEAQLFEGTFNWVIEDGHYELKSGFGTTDAGAPQWGDFEFTVEIDKPRENSTLTLILFEPSAKDGSRTHQLPVKLY